MHIRRIALSDESRSILYSCGYYERRAIGAETMKSARPGQGSPKRRIELLEEHRQEVLGCTRCFPAADNWPVITDAPPRRVVLVGQAPGIRERETRRPFTGPAGKRLDAWLGEAGVSRDEVYITAICKCFPGKAKGGGDLVPSRAMISNCQPYLEREFDLIGPRVVVPVGGLAIRQLLNISRLTDAIGERFERDGTIHVPLPHPSGASTWLNRPENRERLRAALRIVGELVSGERRGERESG